MSLNKVSLIGHLGQTPQFATIAGDRDVANFSIATTDKWKDRSSGEAREKTEWHRIVCYGALAGIVQQYATKGRQVYVEGPLRTREWTDKDGVQRYTTEIVAREVQLLGPKPAGDFKDAPSRPTPANEADDYDTPF